MERKLADSLRRIANLAAAIGLLVEAWLLFWQLPGRIDFMFRSRQLDEAVRVAKARHTPPGTDDRFTLHGIRVEYRRRTAGAYAVTIETANWGHAGWAGYLYSDLPPRRITDGYNNWFLDAP